MEVGISCWWKVSWWSMVLSSDRSIQISANTTLWEYVSTRKSPVHSDVTVCDHQFVEIVSAAVSFKQLNMILMFLYNYELILTSPLTSVLLKVKTGSTCWLKSDECRNATCYHLHNSSNVFFIKSFQLCEKLQDCFLGTKTFLKTEIHSSNIVKLPVRMKVKL